MITRRSLFRWLGGAIAATVAAPILLKSKVAKALGFDPIVNPWYRTQHDMPHWYAGYERLPIETEPVRIVETFSEAEFRASMSARAKLLAPEADAALDKAIDDALRGRHADRPKIRYLLSDFDTLVQERMAAKGFYGLGAPDAHGDCYVRRFCPGIKRVPMNSPGATVNASGLELLQNASPAPLSRLADCRVRAALATYEVLANAS